MDNNNKPLAGILNGLASLVSIVLLFAGVMWIVEATKRSYVVDGDILHAIIGVGFLIVGSMGLLNQLLIYNLKK